MALESSAVNLTANFYMKNFYKFNRNAIKAADRKEFSQTELSYEDTRALKRAIAKLGTFEYEDTDNDENLRNTVKAFVETYNHTVETTSSKDSNTYKLNKQLKELTSKYGDKLDDLGIRIQDDGKLKINDNILKESSSKELKAVFAKDSDYMKDIRQITRRMNNEAHDEVYAMMTGCGGRLNIIL